VAEKCLGFAVYLGGNGVGFDGFGIFWDVSLGLKIGFVGAWA